MGKPWTHSLIPFFSSCYAFRLGRGGDTGGFWFIYLIYISPISLLSNPGWLKTSTSCLHHFLLQVSLVSSCFSLLIIRTFQSQPWEKFNFPVFHSNIKMSLSTIWIKPSWNQASDSLALLPHSLSSEKNASTSNRFNNSVSLGGRSWTQSKQILFGS